jgi:glucose-6-phosphate dehydrogenase assembly protein OpcA
VAADLSGPAGSPPGGAPPRGAPPRGAPPREGVASSAPGAPGDPTLRWSSRATTIPGIEHELARFWALPQVHAAAADPAERTIAARTSVLNLVVVARSPELGERAASTLSMLTGRHPSRTLILVATDPDGPDWLHAQVKAYCMVPRAGAPETCAEQIYATAGGDTGRHLGAIVAPLLVHDLPVTLWWPGDPPFGSPLARDLIGMADRLAVDGSSWAGSGLDRLRALAALGGGPLAISDFALMRQARWREAVASVFDRPEFLPYLRSLRRISVTYGTHGGPDAEARTNIVKPVYHVAWLASRLGLHVVRPLERSGRAGPVRRAAGGLGPDPGRGMRAGLQWPRGTDVEVVIRPVISGMPGGTTLRVEILAERRGTELRAEVTAEAESVHVRVWEDGVEALERTFVAPRRTDVDLLAEAIEAGGRDAVTEGASNMAAALAGPAAPAERTEPSGTPAPAETPDPPAAGAIPAVGGAS